MLSKILSTILAAAIAITPVTASSADYIYRYKFDAAYVGTPPVDETPAEEEPPVGEETEFGKGNDIDAYYVTPVGADFLREIPVLTKAVVRWEKSLGGLPDGIEVSGNTLAGEAEAEEETEATYYGFASDGRRIARAKIFFTTVEADGALQHADFYTHTGRYLYEEIPSAAPGVVEWIPVVENPAGMTNRGPAFEGTPGLAGTYAVAWTGLDFLGVPIAFTYGELLVQDGPVVEDIPDQVADKNEGQTFDVAAVVRHKIGTLSYRLVPVAKQPKGLAFDYERGKVSGVYEEFDTTAQFQIEARDSADGRTGRSNVFSLTTTRAIADLNDLPDMVGVVGKKFGIQLTVGQPGLATTWSVVEGSLPAGITLDTASGLLAGTPERVETIEGIVIEASSVHFDTVRSNAFDFTVLSEELEVEPVALHRRIGQPFSTQPPEIVSGNAPPIAFNWTGTSDDLVFSGADGTFTAPEGIATAGSYHQWIDVSNGGGRSASGQQTIDIYNPLTVSYGTGLEAVRLFDTYIAPDIPEKSIYSPAKFELVEGTLPSWLAFSPQNGVFTGKPTRMEEIGTLGPFRVRLTDSFNEPVLSERFEIEVVDRPQVEIEIVDHRLQRYAENEHRLARATNAMRGVTYTIVDGLDRIPPTLKLTEDGFWMGRTTAPIGTVFENIVVRATDGIGYFADTAPFNLEVVEPWSLGPVEAGSTRDIVWSVDRPFIDATIPAGRYIFGPTEYTLEPNPFDVYLEDKTLTGEISEAGEFSYTYTVDDDTSRTPGVGRVNLVIQPPMELLAEANYDLYRGQDEVVRPQLHNGVSPFEYSLSPDSAIPPGLEFNAADGSIRGVPTQEGVFTATLSVRDRTLARETTVPFTMTVNPPKVFSFSYGNDTLYAGSTDPLVPTLVHQAGDVEWSIASGELPPGVELVPSGDKGGNIGGRPSQTGIFGGIVVFARDTETGETHSEEITIKVSRTGPVVFADTTFRLRAGADNTLDLQAGNLVEPYTFSFAGSNPYPDNLQLSAGGQMGVNFPYAGEYSSIVSVSDLFERGGSASITYDMVDDLLLTVPETVDFTRFVVGSFTPEIENGIGDVTYILSGSSPALPEGLTLSASTGTISGEAMVAGTYGPYVLRATDDHDGQVASSTPFTIAVAMRPTPEIATPADLTALLDNSYIQTLAAKNTVGTLTWQMTTSSALLPAGISFNPVSATFSGVPEVFTTYPGITIRLTDSRNGESVSVTKTFTIDVKQDGTPIVLTAGKGVTRVGNWLEIAGPDVTNTVGNTTWSVSGLEGTGLTMDPVDGSISGRPLAPFSGYATITVSDITGRDASDLVEISVYDNIAVRMADNTALTYNYDYSDVSTNAPSASNTHGDLRWSFANPEEVPPGITINQTTGMIEGRPEAIGTFDGIRISVEDELPGTGTSNPFTFLVTMNEDPIELEAEDLVTKVGYAFSTERPFYDNALGNPFFFVGDGLDGRLSIDGDTGAISGASEVPAEFALNLSITDDTDRVTSKPVKITVLPKMQITAPLLVELEAQEAMTPVAPSRRNVVGEALWIGATGQLPPGVTFDEGTGEFTGTPSQLGTFGPVTVTSIDSLGDTGISNEITFRVIPGEIYLDLDDATLPQATKRVGTYTADLKTHMTAFGISESSMAWSHSGLPAGLSMQNGIISGTPSVTGTFTFNVRVSGGGRSAEASYSLEVTEPSIELALGAFSFPDMESPETLSFDFRSVLTATNIPMQDIAWTVAGWPGATIQNGALSAEGQAIVFADGETEKTVTVTVTARFSSPGEFAEDSRVYTVKVKKVEQGARYWSVTVTSKYSTPAGARPVLRGGLMDHAGQYLSYDSPTFVSKTGYFFNTNYGGGSYMALDERNIIQLSQPIDVRQAYFGQSYDSSHPKTRTLVVEKSNDGIVWEPVFSTTLSSALTQPKLFTW